MSAWSAVILLGTVALGGTVVSPNAALSRQGRVWEWMEKNKHRSQLGRTFREAHKEPPEGSGAVLTLKKPLIYPPSPQTLCWFLPPNSEDAFCLPCMDGERHLKDFHPIRAGQAAASVGEVLAEAVKNPSLS